MESNWIPGLLKAFASDSPAVRHCHELSILLDTVRGQGYTVVEARADAGMIRVRFHGENQKVVRAEIRALPSGSYHVSVGREGFEVDWSEVYDTFQRLLREDGHAG